MNFANLNPRVLWRRTWVRRSVVALAVLTFFRVACLNYCEPTEIGVARNLITGHTWLVRGGWTFKYPWVYIPHIDTRPMLVSVDSAGHGYSAKLVQFVPDEWESFVRTEGFYPWWLANRISFNCGYRHEHRGMKDILRGYAYGSKQYPFLRILNEFDQAQ
ncbi:MAG: hypothetical protein HY975_03865 [Candidatus Kerfeldbacteria bacterium]|nr:hypothetical protein [Candidatus Kerfeldbacteria bacterium]